MNKLKMMIQTLKWARKYKNKPYDDSKIDIYTKDVMKIMRKINGKNIPSYDEVKESIQRIGAKINKKDENK